MEKTLKIIWIAFLAATFAYLVLAFFLTRSGEPNVDPVILAVVAIVAISEGVVTLAWSMNYRRQLYEQRSSGGAAFDPQKHQTTAIIVWAMSESVAVLGLVMAILFNSFYLILPFWALGVVLLMLHSSFIQQPE